MVIAWPGARCTLVADDQGCAEWEYWPRSGADPKLTADLATALLTGRPGPYPRLGGKYGEDGISFKGLVGLELRERGLKVELEVYADEIFFSAQAGIVASDPGQDQDAKVCVTDGGCLTWMRDYCGEAAAVAGSIVETIARAMSHLTARSALG